MKLVKRINNRLPIRLFIYIFKVLFKDKFEISFQMQQAPSHLKAPTCLQSNALVALYCIP